MDFTPPPSIPSATSGSLASWRPGAGLPVPERPNFRLESLLGHGTFGEVWLAWHRHTQEPRVFKFCFEVDKLRALQREITVFRLLKEELGTRPDIVRILDWNFEQPPFFIELEYSSGGDLKAWARPKGGLENLALDLRLNLIRQVAEATAAAHSVGVLHKDIKPENVFVHEQGLGRAGETEIQARLADFGIGQVLDRRRLRRAGITEAGLTVDGSGLDTAGSLLYEAPELLTGQAPTIQADVYALGVLLFQIVVGDWDRPLAPGWQRDVEDELLRELIAEACDARPEERLPDAGILAARLAGLDEERQRRHEARRQEEERERERALVESWQHRRRLMAVALVVAAVFCLVMLGLSSNIEQEVERANREIETADTVSDFLVDLFSDADPLLSSENLRVQDVLTRGRQKAETQLAERPEIQGRLLATLGKMEARLGVLAEGHETLEKALEVRRRVLADDHPDIADNILALGRVSRLMDRNEEAEQYLRRGIELLEARVGGDSPELGTPLKELASIAKLNRLDDEAERLYLRAIEVLEDEPGYEDRLGIAMVDYGAHLQKVGQHEQAVGFLLRARELHEAHLPAEHPILGQLYAIMGDTFSALGDWQSAEEVLEKARDIIEPRVGTDHPYVAAVLSALGRVYHQQGNLDLAESTIERSLEIVRATLGPQSLFLRAPLETLAQIQESQRDEAGLMMVRRAQLELFKAHYPANDPLVTTAEALYAQAVENGGLEKGSS